MTRCGEMDPTVPLLDDPVVELQLEQRGREAPGVESGLDDQRVSRARSLGEEGHQALGEGR